VGFFQKTGRSEALGHRTVDVTHGSGEKSGDCFDHETGRDLSTAQHDVTDADLTVAQMLAHPVVDTFVSTAQQAEPTTIDVGRRQLLGETLIETATARTQQQQWPWWPSGFDRGEDRLGAHHHSGASAERRIVDRAMNVGRVLAQIVTPQIQQAVLAALAEQTLGAEIVDERGEDREHVDSHAGPFSSVNSNNPSGGSITMQ
jgi:hypothetical protein